MEDPYKILGVFPTASDEEIKSAYRALAARYHPDLRPADLSEAEADAKMAELNAAYDEVMRRRRNGGEGPAGAQFSDIRRLINQRRIAQAEELLDGVPQPLRNAEWHFLKGSVLYSRGWFQEAYGHFATAAQTEPQNPEYTAAFRQMNERRSGTYNGGYRTAGGNSGCSSCDICSSLICADCCCESMGGDLIPCC